MSFYSITSFLIKLQDKVGSWFSNPSAGKAEPGGAGSGGVGKYLRARIGQGSSDATENGSTVTKKRKVGALAGEYGNFSSW